MAKIELKMDNKILRVLSHTGKPVGNINWSAVGNDTTWFSRLPFIFRVLDFTVKIHKDYRAQPKLLRSTPSSFLCNLKPRQYYYSNTVYKISSPFGYNTFVAETNYW